jgi:hypothetical protein
MRLKTILLLSAIMSGLWSSNYAVAQSFTFVSGQLTYSETFDGMGSTGTIFPQGWGAIRHAGTDTIGAALVLKVTDGTASTGAIYNVGVTSSTDRALGTLASGATVPRFGTSFLNNTGTSITSLQLALVMEQWRSASNSSLNEVCAFEYSVDATSLSTGTWVAFSALDLNEKQTSSASAGALDGNLPENQTSLNAEITNLNLNPGSTVWIRWSDVNDGGSDGIYAIDNLQVTAVTGTVVVAPEPDNYPGNFQASASGNAISASWNASTGTQLPSAYLLILSTTKSAFTPVDGTFVSDDSDLSDGVATKNIAFGNTACTFTGLSDATTYYVKIYPYTNGGNLVDFKTDGTAPSAQAKTQSVVTTSNFNTDLSPWTQFSVTGTQVWVSDLTHGTGGSGCAKMSGFETGASHENVDWLISPSLDFTNYTNLSLQFYTAFNYEGNPLMVMFSNDYTQGDPSVNGTWADLTQDAVFSAGGWAWTASGFIPLNVDNQANVHIAFKYTSDNTASRTWEVDDVVIAATGNGLGIFDDEKVNKSTSVFPNPCNGNFVVKCNNESENEIIIYAQDGSIRFRSTINNSSSSVSFNASPGLYFVSILNKASLKTEYHKLVIR